MQARGLRRPRVRERCPTVGQGSDLAASEQVGRMDLRKQAPLSRLRKVQVPICISACNLHATCVQARVDTCMRGAYLLRIGVGAGHLLW